METSLTAEQVKARKAKSMAQSICFISLRELTDETRFTVVGPSDHFNVHNKYSNDVMAAMNK